MLPINDATILKSQQTFRTGTKFIILADSEVILSGTCSQNSGARRSFFAIHNRHISRKFNVILNVQLLYFKRLHQTQQHIHFQG
jgi:hypothetical protein